jgi:succinate dehydrogenase / fumarate reductase cytochrome b subunit
MIYTGTIILVFLVLHIIHFKFGADYSITLESGKEVRDLRKLVLEEFQKPGIVAAYVGVLALAIFHLSHGFWSAFTSLGMKHGETSKKVQTAAYAFALVIMLAFIFIPLYIFITGGQGSLISY